MPSSVLVNKSKNASPLRRRRVLIRRTGFTIGALVLSAGFLAVVIGDALNVETGLHADILATLATKVPGWAVLSLPLGDSPEQIKVVEDTLQCDRAINLQYTRDDFRISVYAAYWRPGKTPVHLVARHTPDNCWVAAGWRLIDRAPMGVPSKAGDAPDVPADHRVFQNGGNTEHVVFFHVIDGQISSLAQADQALGPLFGWVNNLFRFEFLFWHINRDRRGLTKNSPTTAVTDRNSWFDSLFRQRREQIFVRISSNRPAAAFWPTPVVTEFIRQLPISTPHGLTSGRSNL